MGIQVVASVGTVFTIWAGKAAWMARVVSVYMSCEVCFTRKGTGAERALITEVTEERRHGLGVVAAVALSAKGLVLKRVAPGSVIAFLAWVELVKFVGGERGDTKERTEEDFQVFVVSRGDGIDGKWSERDVDDGQCDVQVTFSRSETVDNSGVEFMRVREVEVEAATMSEPFGAQGTLVEATRGVEDERVVLELAITGGGEGAVWAVKR